MRYRPLGATGLKVSEIGFGCWGLGGYIEDAPPAYGPTSDQESLKALQTALELGINFYDTADLYGLGHSEKLLGQAFKNVREQVIITSKVGYLNRAGDQDFSLNHIQQSLEGTLKRLQNESVDLYQLHDPLPEQLNDNIFELLIKLKQEGKIRAIGVSLRSPQLGLDLIPDYPVEAIEANFNLADQRALQYGLWELCQKKQVGVIVRTPLCFGFLTGHYKAEDSFSIGDHRQRWPVEKRQQWIDSQSLMDKLDSTGITPAQQALQFCLSYPEVSTVIPGMLTPEHVMDNAGTVNFPLLNDTQKQQIEAAYAESEK